MVQCFRVMFTPPLYDFLLSGASFRVTGTFFCAPVCHRSRLTALYSGLRSFRCMPSSASSASLLKYALALARKMPCSRLRSVVSLARHADDFFSRTSKISEVSHGRLCGFTHPSVSSAVSRKESRTNDHADSTSSSKSPNA